MHLALALAPPAQGLPHNKAVAASTLQGKMQPMVTSDPALLPKTVGICTVYRDTPMQGHAFKIKIVRIPIVHLSVHSSTIYNSQGMKTNLNIQFPLIDELIKMFYTHTHTLEYYSAIKWNTIHLQKRMK